MKDVANAPEIKRLESMREMQPYNNPTRAMFIGAPGKVGYLRLGFEIDAWGKSILRDHERIAPLIVQQELYCDEGMPEMPVVYIISSGGPNVEATATNRISRCVEALLAMSQQEQRPRLLK